MADKYVDERNGKKQKLDVLSYSIHLQPPKFLEQLILHWKHDKGWMFEFWVKNAAFGDHDRYFVLESIAIFGFFNAQDIKNMSDAAFYSKEYTPDEFIGIVSKFKKSDYDKFIKMSKEITLDRFLRSRGIVVSGEMRKTINELEEKINSWKIKI